MFDSTLAREEIDARGRALFEQHVPRDVAAREEGRYYVVDVLSGEYEIGRTDMEATEDLQSRQPGGIFWGTRIGFAAAYRLSRIRVTTCLCVLLLAWSQARTFAQAKPGTAQPDRLDFGRVNVGAIVEGSVRVWDEGDRAAGVAIAVQPPSFVRVIRAEPGIRNSENMASRVYCDVSLAVDTAQAGEYSGSLTVGVGTRVVELPTSVRVVEPGPNQIRLLVVETPFEKFSTSNADMFKSWLQLVETARLDVDYLEVVRPRSVLGDRDLDRYQVILLGEGGVCFALEDDVDRLLRFIDGGGRVIVCANRYFVPSVQGANELLGPCGLRIDDEEVRRRAGNIDISGGDIRDDGVLKDVRRLRFFRPSPIALIDLKAAKLLVSAPQFPGRGYVASARFGQGEIIAIGQSLWWNWIGDAKFDGFDNAALLQKLLTSGVDTTGEGGSDANPM